MTLLLLLLALCIGGQAAADFNGAAGKGGQPGDWTHWPTSTIEPEHGGAGLVVISL